MTGGTSSGSSGTTGGAFACLASTPAATLYSNECPNPEATTFCLFTQNTGF